MHLKLLVSLLPYLLVYNTLARPVTYEDTEDDVVAVGSYIREVRQLAPFKAAIEVKDLLSVSNAPKSKQDARKRVKNASGMSFVINTFDKIYKQVTAKKKSHDIYYVIRVVQVKLDGFVTV